MLLDFGPTEAEMGRTNKESKREAFIRLAQKRTNAVITRIRVLSNCANPYAYDYSEDDVRRIFKAIDDELRTAKNKFVQRETTNVFKLN
jgi:hypothetical protein